MGYYYCSRCDLRLQYDGVHSEHKVDRTRGITLGREIGETDLYAFTEVGGYTTTTTEHFCRKCGEKVFYIKGAAEKAEDESRERREAKRKLANQVKWTILSMIIFVPFFAFMGYDIRNESIEAAVIGGIVGAVISLGFGAVFKDSDGLFD